MARLSIGKRLTLTFAVVLVLQVVASFALSQMQEQSSITQRIVNVLVLRSALAEDLQIIVQLSSTCAR